MNHQGQELRFDFTCRGCPVQATAGWKVCYACVLEGIFQVSDLPCCPTCRAPIPDTPWNNWCSTCSARTFDGSPILLDRFEVAGIGKTVQGEDWHHRQWKQLGSAVAAFKKSNIQSLFFPLSALFMRKLHDFLAEAGGAFDVITYVPTGSSLLPRLARIVAENTKGIGLTGPIVDDLLIKTQGSRGGDHLAPHERWADFNAAGLYHLGPGQDVRGKRILLLDDVYKSGCSMNLCAKVLKAADAREVVGFALCRWP